MAPISSALVLTATASRMLCWESETALTQAYWRGATHCCNSNGRAGVAITWKATRKNRARNRTRKFVAAPCRKRNGSIRSRDVSTSGVGRKRENQVLKGRDRSAEVIHQTP